MKRGILCYPCYRAIRNAVLAPEGEGLLEDISIETAMRFATDPRYAAAYASHRCKGGACVCVCHASSPDEAAADGARRRTDDNLRSVFG